MARIIISNTQKDETNFEFVERKGVGHPDTLSDALAEKLSREYSNYTLKEFGAVLHHNFDKVGLLGGSSYVVFGTGYLVRPIRVLINGRVSTNFSNKKIPVRRLLINWTKDFFKDALPIIDVEDDLEFHMNLSNQSSPGKTYEKESKRSARRHWFEPQSLRDIPELTKLVSNDTSLGVGYYPLTKLEKTVLDIERELTTSFRKSNVWTGTDIKIMGVRVGESFEITLCIPQIANYVLSLDEYKNNLKRAKSFIEKMIVRNGISKYKLNINTRDNYKLIELYLTATGSSIESGDEGLVGRGNRLNGVISPLKPMSMEGASGKNPVYHIGKLYYAAAFDIAKRIYETFHISNEVYIVSQSGRELTDPWVTIVAVPSEFKKKNELESFIDAELEKIPQLTPKILSGSVKMF